MRLIQLIVQNENSWQHSGSALYTRCDNIEHFVWMERICGFVYLCVCVHFLLAPNHFSPAKYYSFSKLGSRNVKWKIKAFWFGYPFLRPILFFSHFRKLAHCRKLDNFSSGLFGLIVILKRLLYTNAHIPNIHKRYIHFGTAIFVPLKKEYESWLIWL